MLAVPTHTHTQAHKQTPRHLYTRVREQITSVLSIALQHIGVFAIERFKPTLKCTGVTVCVLVCVSVRICNELQTTKSNVIYLIRL